MVAGHLTVSSYRTLPLVPPFEKLLFKVNETQKQNRQYYGCSYCKDYLEYVCVDPMGHLLKPNFETQHFSLLLERNGLKRIRYHDLRHSYASLLYTSGIGLKEIQERLGHSDIGTTSDIYTHLDYDSKVASANLLLTQFAGRPYTNQGIDNKCPVTQNYGIKSKKEKTQSRFP